LPDSAEALVVVIEMAGAGVSMVQACSGEGIGSDAELGWRGPLWRPHGRFGRNASVVRTCLLEASRMSDDIIPSANRPLGMNSEIWTAFSTPPKRQPRRPGYPVSILFVIVGRFDKERWITARCSAAADRPSAMMGREMG
jgi:hypothetical protein